MLEQRYRWKSKHLREHVDVLDGNRAPHILLINATYLNQVLRKWITANIWIYHDRIIYVGEMKPECMEGCEIVDCTGQYLVPGYIEPHSHPFQLYNPQTFSCYASSMGTTTLINDNLLLLLQLEKKKAFSLLKELQKLPASIYWWIRFDAQTELNNDEEFIPPMVMKSWLEHDAVLQGGELTGWPQLVDGDDMMLHWLQEAKRLRKRIEGHFPGASERTLAKMTLFGVDSDHEAMSGEEVLSRLMQGYYVALRHSSIRPDLPKLVQEIHELGIDQYSKLFLTTDGSTPSYYENGFMDTLIKLAIENGIPVIDAYNMATINIARYYNIDYLHGNIATGRVANINFLSDIENPTPVSVLAKGNWIRRNGIVTDQYECNIDWCEFDFEPLNIDWDLTILEDFEFSMPFGIQMVDNVITKPYSIMSEVSLDELPHDSDECFFILIDRNGHWRINTILKGFADSLSGFACSYSSTGDIVLIGKNKHDMIAAFNHMKTIGGGIVIVENNQVIGELPLTLKGLMSAQPVPELIKEEKKIKSLLQERGYKFEDPMYTLLFFSSTHLPYIRVTQQGVYDVMNKTILFPTIIR